MTRNATFIKNRMVVKCLMEFNEKLQELRKRKGLTQEELSQALFVSRTAISKWESGRGFPNIESLKAISKYFSVSLDELLSGKALLAIAETDQQEKERMTHDLIFGLLDCSAALLLFLPIFGQESDGIVSAVSLLRMTGIRPYLRIAYLSIILAVVLLGILTLALQNCRNAVWVRNKRILSLVLGAAGVCLFIISRQPYAGIFTLAFIIIKSLFLIKRS